MFSSVGCQHMRSFKGLINHQNILGKGDNICLEKEKLSRRKRWRYGIEGEMKTERKRRGEIN